MANHRCVSGPSALVEGILDGTKPEIAEGWGFWCRNVGGSEWSLVNPLGLESVCIWYSGSESEYIGVT